MALLRRHCHCGSRCDYNCKSLFGEKEKQVVDVDATFWVIRIKSGHCAPVCFELLALTVIALLSVYICLKTNYLFYDYLSVIFCL